MSNNYSEGKLRWTSSLIAVFIRKPEFIEALVALIIIHLAFSSAYAIKIASSIPFKFFSVGYFFITVSAAVLTLLIFYVRKLEILKDKMKTKHTGIIYSLIFIASILLVIWLLTQALLVAFVKLEYSAIVNQYRSMVNKATNGFWEKLTIDILWNITKNVKEEFTVTYGRAGFIPSRFLDENGPLNYVMFPIFAYYYSMWRNEFIVVQRTGACSEFATTITTLLRDVAGTPTRKIVLQGIDHALPEVYFKGEWWVFDIFYTTQNNPVKAETYATYLKHERNGFDKYVSRMLVEESGLDVTREHGFNTSTLTIKAIIDVVTPPTEDTPAANAEVEIFALENLYDPLVA